jgi:hypothetical protein
LAGSEVVTTRNPLNAASRLALRISPKAG